MDSIELFGGTGGLALGLELAGFAHKAIYEWDKDSCDNLNFNINNGYKPELFTALRCQRLKAA